MIDRVIELWFIRIKGTRINPGGGTIEVANAINVIKPYWEYGTWVFDDESVGLIKEPFVKGVPEIIDYLVRHIPDARNGFRLLFSSSPFPDYQIEIIKVREEYGGYWYRLRNTPVEGWLCPALFRYFDTAPDTIYFRVEPCLHEDTTKSTSIRTLEERINIH